MELKSWETAVRLEEGTPGLVTVEIELEVELFSTDPAWGVVAWGVGVFVDWVLVVSARLGKLEFFSKTRWGVSHWAQVAGAMERGLPEELSVDFNISHNLALRDATAPPAAAKSKTFGKQLYLRL